MYIHTIYKHISFSSFFPIAISKESRNIFMELDANNAYISNANNNGKRNQTVDYSKNQNQYGQEVGFVLFIIQHNIISAIKVKPLRIG